MYNSIYLAHHGVKGMKWGIRKADKRKQGRSRKKLIVNEQLGLRRSANSFVAKNNHDKTAVNYFKAGSTVTHITPKNFKALKPGQDLYVSADPYDKVTYRTFLSLMLKHKGYGDKGIKEVRFVLKNDLKAPSINEQEQIFKRTFPNNRNYDAFIKSLDTPSKDKTIFYNALKREGYNAIVDTHDIDNSWMQAKRPLIVMDALNNLGDMKIKTLTNDDLQKSLKEWDTLNKK